MRQMGTGLAGCRNVVDTDVVCRRRCRRKCRLQAQAWANLELGRNKDKMRIFGPVYLAMRWDAFNERSARQKEREAALRGNWQLMDNCDGGCAILYGIQVPNDRLQIKLLDAPCCQTSC